MIHIIDANSLMVGDKVTRLPKSFGTFESLGTKSTEQMRMRKRYTGEVVYIHPEKRFYVLEYTFGKWGGGTAKIRESYKFDTPAADEEYQPEKAILTKHSKMKGNKRRKK